jgi:acyl-CoA reductase-like NAD-dependent aldehyde dehydrogenase
VTDTACHLIDGRLVPGRESFEVVNPATGAPFAACPAATHEDVAAAASAAAVAFESGWAADEPGRRAVLGRMADAVEAEAEALGRLVCSEQGKPLSMAIVEAQTAAGILRLYAADAIPFEVLRETAAGRVTLERRPLGPTAAITPWNYPLATLAMKVAPALLVGNTVVAKPSPFTPLSSLAFARAVHEIVPPGVLNVLGGGDEVGAWLTEHPAIRKIAFTGSVETGKAIARAAAGDLKRITLELGGNDPAVVLADVDPAAVGQALFWSAFYNSGQICMAVKRVYAHTDVYEPLCDALVQAATAARVGDPLAADTEMGPVSTAPQLARVVELVDDARTRGARILTGGRRLDGPGFFYPPTIVADVPPDARLVLEEQFGPVLPVVRVDDVDTAVARANDGPFGLSGSVWTADVERGEAIARRLVCGTTWVNAHMDLGHDAPFGGRKWSGVGHENGPWGIDGYCDWQVVNVHR